MKQTIKTIGLSLILATALLNATQVGDAQSFDSATTQSTNTAAAYQADIDEVTQIIKDIPENLSRIKGELREVRSLNGEMLVAIDMHLKLTSSYTGSNNERFKHNYNRLYKSHNPGVTLQSLKIRIDELRVKVEKNLSEAQKDADSVEGYYQMLNGLKAQKALIEKVERAL